MAGIESPTSKNTCNDGTLMEDHTQENGMNMGEFDSLMPDYSVLPDIVWVNIMSHLSMAEKNRLSQTCKILYDTFFHPSLWHTMKLQLQGGFKSARVAGKLLQKAKEYNEEATKFIEKDIKLVETFGHLFRDLTIVIDGYWWGYPEQWHKLLSLLSTNCRLEYLSLNIKNMAKPLTWVNEDVDTLGELQHFVTLLYNCVKLKSFHLVSWPHDFGETYESEATIFQVLMNNQQLAKLQTLRLFWVKETSWTNTSVRLPSPDQTVQLACHFQNLTQLGIRSPMLSDELLLSLASKERAPIQKLQILITFSAHNPQLQLPFIASKTWISLKKVSPKLEVECTVLSRVPEIELAFFLRPEMPLHVINFMEYSRCDGSVITSLTTHYSQTLRRFVCYCEAEDIDTELTEMVEKSPLLRCFVYHGHVSSSTVKTIASMRGRNWFRFEVYEDNIDTIEGQFYYAPDEVIARGQDGQFELVKSLKHRQMVEAEEFREENLKELSKVVSSLIGYNWKPVTKQKDDDSAADDPNSMWLRHHLFGLHVHPAS